MIKSVIAASFVGLSLAGGLAAAAPADAATPDLKLSIPAGGGSSSALVQRGGAIADVSLQLDGPSSYGATLTLTVQAGAAIYEVDTNGDAATCTKAANVYTCTLGTLHGSTDIDVGLQVAASAAIGATGSIHAVVAPVGGSDPKPADNTVNAPYEVVGNATLHQSVTPSSATVAVGSTTTLTATLRNDGPDPATNAVMAFFLGDPDSFLVTDSSAPHDVDLEDPSYFVWYPATIPAGGSVTLQITVKALQPAQASELSYYTIADGIDGVCDGEDDSCIGTVLLKATAGGSTSPAPTTAPSTSPASDPAGGAPITSSDPTSADPTTGGPTSADPTTGAPSSDPASTDPTTSDPTTTDPASTDPTDSASADPTQDVDALSITDTDGVATDTTLASTGSPTSRLSLVAAALLIGGTALTLAGRRRRGAEARRPRHSL
ncbi:DUF11 domain-containing protein [Jatrophihabitans sp. GAS493]|uniref:DUF11 domain-containing protein n=1 Tax=Jatrophihabitans sp. GAS493 TaxID=1907575 RepID=UPI0012FE0324|nr:DUF11 domain-containing protein [Jatrophihabitans sp. GAS493]